MKRLALLLALASTIAIPAMADQSGGLSGYVVDITTGRPLSNVQVNYYRSPWVDNATIVKSAQTNKRGFFSDITLEPGRYVLMTKLPGRVVGCAVDDVMGGETTRVKIEIGHDRILCSGPRVHPALVDPAAVADVYRI